MLTWQVGCPGSQDSRKYYQACLSLGTLVFESLGKGDEWDISTILALLLLPFSGCVLGPAHVILATPLNSKLVN